MRSVVVGALAVFLLSCGAAEEEVATTEEAAGGQHCGSVTVHEEGGYSWSTGVQCYGSAEPEDPLLHGGGPGGGGDANGIGPDGSYVGNGNAKGFIDVSFLGGTDPLEYCVDACELGGEACQHMCDLFFSHGKDMHTCRNACVQGGQFCENMCYWFFTD